MTFAKTNADGTPKTCKFCHKPVWFETDKRRWYNVGGETLHVENCPRRATHYRNRALAGAEVRRRKRAEQE